MKISKSDYILQSIIKAYLCEQSPVGSMYLQDTLNVPASTIRLYFKRLGDEGLLAKQHASSGRTPTASAMKAYWSKYFSRLELSTRPLQVLNDSAFFKLIDEFELFCLAIDERSSTLDDVINIKNKHLFLEFSNFIVVLPYSSPSAALFSELLGCDEASVLQVLERLNLGQISAQLACALAANKAFYHGLFRLRQMSAQEPKELLNQAILRTFLHPSERAPLAELLDSDYLCFSVRANYQNVPVRLVFCGSAHTDYEKFFTTFKEVL